MQSVTQLVTLGKATNRHFLSLFQLLFALSYPDNFDQHPFRQGSLRISHTAISSLYSSIRCVRIVCIKEVVLYETVVVYIYYAFIDSIRNTPVYDTGDFRIYYKIIRRRKVYRRDTYGRILRAYRVRSTYVSYLSYKRRSLVCGVLLEHVGVRRYSSV